MADNFRENSVSLGANIRDRRKELGISQVELARLVGTSFPRVSELEAGKANPTMKTISRLAEVLGTTPSDLLAEKKPHKI